MSQLQEYVDSQVATISPFKIKSQELLEQAKAKEVTDDATAKEAVTIRKLITSHRTEVIIDQFQFLSDAKGSGNNAAPATERYAEDDAKKATSLNNNQSAKTVADDIDLSEPIDLSEIPF